MYRYVCKNCKTITMNAHKAMICPVCRKLIIYEEKKKEPFKMVDKEEKTEL